MQRNKSEPGQCRCAAPWRLRVCIAPAARDGEHLLNLVRGQSSQRGLAYFGVGDHKISTILCKQPCPDERVDVLTDALLVQPRDGRYLGYRCRVIEYRSGSQDSPFGVTKLLEASHDHCHNGLRPL